MGHLHTSLALLFILCSPWLGDGKTFFTHLGTLCIEDCKPDYLGQYKCKTIDKDGKCQEMYCSPQENMDYQGRLCSAESMCGKHGEDYYWCRINILHWGYCGLVTENKNYYGSSYGSLCYDHCDKRNADYYWCNTAQGWDKCSPSKNTDYYNKQCKEDSPCGKHGHDYYWCNRVEGSWDYCGLVEPKMLLHRSKYHYVCIDECQYYESGDYYWCHTTTGWEYCSPDVDVTYKGKPCRSDHSCGLHGSSYNWCWTSESGYDFCGPIESGECTYITSRNRNRRAPNKRVLICTVKDKGNKRTTIFYADPAPHHITDGSQWREEAESLISRWENEYLVDQGRSDLVPPDPNNQNARRNLRIDMQGIIANNNQRYYNLQIQLNTRRGPGESTTVSQIIVPCHQDIPRRYIRRAFLESFRRRARIIIEITSGNQC